MDGSVRSFVLALAAIAFATARGYIPSHDNILRIQLWDAEGLSRDPITTRPPSTTTQPPKHKLKVSLDSLNNAMLEEEYGSGFGKFIRHKVRHKRRRPRESGTDLPWRFHSGSGLVNVEVYDDDVPWNQIDGAGHGVNVSVVSESAYSGAEGVRDVSPPMNLQQLEDEEEEAKLPVVPKCCASGQNISVTVDSQGAMKSICARTTLTFQPLFYKSNDSFMWSFDTNVYETIVGNPCIYDRYKLEPDKISTDEFYLLVNGSLFLPFGRPILLGNREFCMETFWNESNPAGVTLPLVCFTTDAADTSGNVTLSVYATGLLISVPFLLATAFIFVYITKLRDTHGKALACHSTCLAVAFLCLAATQLAGHAFPVTICTIMAYLIQFSFVSCFFWLNVMCFDTYLNVRRFLASTTVSRRSMRRRFACYCVYAVVLPLVLLIVTVTMDLSPAVPSTYLKPDFGVKGCWFKTDQAALPYFYGPVAIILISNIILFVITSREFAINYEKLKVTHFPLDSTYSENSTSEDFVHQGPVLGQIMPRHSAISPQDENYNYREILRKYRTIFRKCCLLSVIMGLSWALEVVSWAAGAGSTAVSVWSLFDLINALQGPVIFAIFVLREPVRSLVWESKLFESCRRKNQGSEEFTVNERKSIIGPRKGDHV
ncbi:G-protein coupled receptor Mth2-like [Galleria mellonella]|uniref:G-protein coupled receptor Mth2-like n=1 Tax=Galleria mellonella TaxID=7137 RepID=A0ABM3M9I7_GALME|nr:G-protein coupled receptor Mth2-like [Galleria mellonella]